MPRISMIDIANKDVKVDKLDVEFDDNDFVSDLMIKAKYAGYILVVDYSKDKL